MNENLKDWQIAQFMFGKNSKSECYIVKKLRKYGKKIETLNDGWNIIYDSRYEDDCGWLLPDECL